MAKNKNLEALLSALSERMSDEDLLLSYLQSDIAAAITEARIDTGISQKALADAVGVSQGLVSRWENGDGNFTLKTLVKIAICLSIDIRSPFVSKRLPHYHTVKNVTPFPAQWSGKGYSYTSPADYSVSEELEEM